jgi:hypothetical protein
MRGIAGASIASVFGLVICAVPALVGAWFAFRPSERVLSLMRPLTMAAIFSALCSFVLAITNGFQMVATMKALDLNGVRVAALVLTEGLAPVVASFACLTVAWACVAIGTRRG